MKITILKSVMDNLYKKYLIPMVLLNSDWNIVHPEIKWKPEYMNKISPQQEPHSKLYLFNDCHFFYGYFLFADDKGEKYSLLIGPCGIIGEPSDSLFFNEQLYLYKVHYTKESVANFEEFAKMLYALVTNIELSSENIHWHFKSSKNIKHYREKNLEENIYARRTQEMTLDSYQFELRYIEYIRRNKPEKIEWLFRKMNDTYKVDLSKNQLEHLKLKFSAFIAVITRVSIDEGIPINQAFSLSDALIQGLKHIVDYDEWLIYIKEATYRFMELIQDYALSKKSSTIKNVICYIDAHLYEKITLEDLSHHINKNKNHLSSIFKKEMNITIHQYIQKQKIIEAKHLLLFTDRPYLEISTLLSFASQSHFIQVFRKVTHCTPKTYKEKYSY